MPVVQDAFFIPEDITTGLAKGLYRRIGSVVRYAAGPNKGNIVKHLEPVDLKAAKEARGIGVKALQFVKGHKKETIITLVVVGAVSAISYSYIKLKNYEPKEVTDFRAALKVYIDAIRKGNMDIDIINNMMDALEKLKRHKKYDKISIQFTAEELAVLVESIYEYTTKLAKDNDIELTEYEHHASNTKPLGTITILQNCLKAQKRIFEETA